MRFRLFPCAFAALVSLAACAAGSRDETTHFTLFDGEQAGTARVLDSLLLRGEAVDGLPLVELSDLAWDRRNRRLYLVSDDGYLFVARVAFERDRLKSLRFVAAHRLRDRRGRALRGDAADAEGLAIAGWDARGEPELLVSFEHGARILRYSAEGRWLERLRLPKPLRRAKAYRGKNHQLEALAWHPRFGVLTAAERALKRDRKRIQRVFSLDGRSWRFPAWRRKKAAITAIEVTADGNLLLLERAWAGIPSPVHIGLRKLYLLERPEGGETRVESLAAWSTGDGWRLDNFEGLTRLDADRYLLVSDNNEALLQNSLLVLIELNGETNGR